MVGTTFDGSTLSDCFGSNWDGLVSDFDEVEEEDELDDDDDELVEDDELEEVESVGVAREIVV